MRRNVLSTVAVVVLAIAQAAFAWHIRGIDPKRDYLAPPPSPVEQTALSFGDSQFLYRVYALDVQNAGDTGGRIVPVKNYDFSRVTGWLDTLAQMDPRSDFAIGMANGFFGQSQNVKDVDPIVRFMMRDVAANPQQRWHWLYDAIYLARHRLRDDDLALEVAWQLNAYDFDDVEPWATLMPAFILEDHGRYAEAAAVAQGTQHRFGPRMNADDAAWTRAYLDYLAKVQAGLIPPRRKAYGPNAGSNR